MESKNLRMTETAGYLDHLLLKYSNTFNIYKPYCMDGKEYPAYGYFYSHNEKYVLVRKANMWTTHSYEHVLFMEAEDCTEETLREASGIIQDYMEPKLVRKGEKLPEPNHMSSYLNVVIICANGVNREIEKKIKHFHFEKGYNFNMRGFSQGTIICVSLADRHFISSYHGRTKKKIFQQVFADMEQERPGFDQVMKENGLTPYNQYEDNI